MKVQYNMEALEAAINIYKNGIETWAKDVNYLPSCAYYEGVIYKFCEFLNIPIPFTNIIVNSACEDNIQEAWNRGYNFNTSWKQPKLNKII